MRKCVGKKLVVVLKFFIASTLSYAKDFKDFNIVYIGHVNNLALDIYLLIKTRKKVSLTR